MPQQVQNLRWCTLAGSAPAPGRDGMLERADRSSMREDSIAALGFTVIFLGDGGM
jgi:hypothetical protein